MHTCTHAHVHTSTHAHTHTHTRTHTHVHTYTHARTHTHTQVPARVQRQVAKITKLSAKPGSVCTNFCILNPPRPQRLTNFLTNVLRLRSEGSMSLSPMPLRHSQHPARLWPHPRLQKYQTQGEGARGVIVATLLSLQHTLHSPHHWPRANKVRHRAVGKEEEEVGGKVSQIFSSAHRDWRKEDGGLELTQVVVRARETR